MSQVEFEAMKQQFTDSHIKDYTLVSSLVKSAKETTIIFESIEERIQWADGFLRKVRYKNIRSKKARGEVREYIQRVTGVSQKTITLWIKSYKKGKLKSKRYKRHKFASKYTREDILLLVEVDESTERISASSLKKLFEREYKIFGNDKFERLSGISRAHINNLRSSPLYKAKSLHFETTHPNHASFLPIGKMSADGKPGYLRVDTVHSGIWNEQKGLYFINIIDDVLQTEYGYTVPVISERYISVVLEYLMNAFWTPILGFHSDGGSEFNNSIVVKLLNKLLIKEYNRSRPYHSNDNALIEMKNGFIIRKHFGFGYIPKEYSDTFNVYLDSFFNPYLNFHRSCGYLTGTHKSNKGRTIREYAYYNTPYELFKEKYITYLKKDMSIVHLDTIAYAMSDYEAAKLMKEKKDQLFKDIFNHLTK